MQTSCRVVLSLIMSLAVAAAAPAGDRPQATKDGAPALGIAIDPEFVSVGGEGATPQSKGSFISMLFTELGEANCLNKPGGFELYDLTPTSLAARQREIELCSSGYVDKATCAAFQTPSPSHAIAASVTIDRNGTTAAIQVVDHDGKPIASADDFGTTLESAVQSVAAKLVENLCRKEGSLEVVESRWVTKPTDLCDGGAFLTAQFNGHASGDVGAVIRSNLGPHIGGSLTCGSWTAYSCSNDLFFCCTREDNQPERTTFSAKINIPFAVNIPGYPSYRVPWCPEMQRTEIQLIIQHLGKGIERESRLGWP